MTYTPVREAVEFAFHVATHGARGTQINAAVAEGRDKLNYSSCGDLLHAMLFACGCREDWINRAEHKGWTSQVNLSRVFSRKGVVVNPSLGDIGPGACCMYDGSEPRAHGFVYLTRRKSTATTADFGQPGGRVYANVPIVESRGQVFFRGRRVTHVLPLQRVTFAVPALTVGEWLAERGLDERDWIYNGKTADDLVEASELDAVDRGQNV